jgi:hypothetical protein
MKKFIVKNKYGIIGKAEAEDPTTIISEGIAGNWWGKPERQVLHKDEPGAEPYDDADVLEEIVIEDIPAIPPQIISEAVPAIPAVMDEAGNIVQAEIPEVPAVYSEEIPAKTHKEVKLRAEYTIEIIDISAETALAECLAKRKAEYPSAEEFLNAFFDGGEAGLASLHAKRLEIKAKYPKP